MLNSRFVNFRTAIKHILLVVLVSLAGSVLCVADECVADENETAILHNQSQDEINLESTKRALTKHIEQTLKDTDIPSISIALIQNGKVTWTAAFGYANKKQKVKATPEMIYGTGSCLKPITSMAVMQLVDRGLLKLDDPVNLHLGKHKIKQHSPDGKPITIRHLLSHYSGLKNQTLRYPVWKRKLPMSLEELSAELETDAEPGARYHYSNSAYALAGLIVQKVSGQSYESYLVNNLLKPTGSSNDGPIHPTAKTLEQRAFPYQLEDGRAIPVDPQRFDIYPAGDAYISVPDMARLLCVHLNEGMAGEKRILSKQSVKEMGTRQFGGEGGLDFGIIESAGERFLMHGGQVPGWNTKFVLATKSKTGVYLASNASNGQLPINITAQLAVDLIMGKKVGEGLIKKIVHLGISFQKDKQTQLLRAQAIFPNSSASKAGVLKGTLIRAINGKEVKELTMGKCLRLMEGGIGKEITLELVDPVNSHTKSITLSKQVFLAPS